MGFDLFLFGQRNNCAIPGCMFHRSMQNSSSSPKLDNNSSRAFNKSNANCLSSSNIFGRPSIHSSPTSQDLAHSLSPSMPLRIQPPLYNTTQETENTNNSTALYTCTTKEHVVGLAQRHSFLFTS
jgi:hypothetical protein